MVDMYRPQHESQGLLPAVRFEQGVQQSHRIRPARDRTPYPLARLQQRRIQSIQSQITHPGFPVPCR